MSESLNEIDRLWREKYIGQSRDARRAAGWGFEPATIRDIKWDATKWNPWDEAYGVYQALYEFNDGFQVWGYFHE